MEIGARDIVLVCDRVGIVAFAFSGVELGARKHFDIFGLLVMGVVTATGGGLIRDLILDRVPFVIAHADYLGWAVGASLLSMAVLAWRRPLPRWAIAGADALGLGAFAVAGAFAAIDADFGPAVTVLLAAVTATGGGLLRDVLAARVPLVLRAEINATAAMLGGFLVWALHTWTTEGAALAGLAVTAMVRAYSVARHVNLPRPFPPPAGEE
ncbi:MAG: TRIC cation channel family protein [Chloroflexota bacterium]|nr:TRIC cation channel family protein [Dehalococcoidia bacterium]MDW8046628.1 TRIC cation channel family protein [Chloroflexota bacterium]